MKHLEVAEIAKLLSDGSVGAETCRHLAESCPICAERLSQVEALMKRFRHWDAETVVREAPAAESLLDILLEQGEGRARWILLVEENPDLQTWCVAWIALERAQALLTSKEGKGKARDLALLAVAIAGHLGASYHPDSIADLKALAYATAAAAKSLGTDALFTLRQVAAAVMALDEGTGDPTVAREVLGLLGRFCS